MSLVLTSVFLLMLASSSFEVDVQIVMKNEPRTEVDDASHVVQAEEKLFGNPCSFKKTCGECTRNRECAWCRKEDMNYTAGGKKRCDYRNTIQEECGREEMVIPRIWKQNEDSRGDFVYHRYGDEMNTFVGFHAERDLPLVAFRYHNVPENVQVIDYKISCIWHDTIVRRLNKNSCRDVKKDEYVQFYMVLKRLSCPEKWNPIMQIHRLHGEDKVGDWEVNLAIICECECELTENEERNSPKCSGRGTYECGICSCPDNWYGKECECEGKQTADNDDDRPCVAPGDTKICSGRGRCCSGICQCFNKTSMTGHFCECDACPQSEDGQICGGKDRGKCVCGNCECSDGWTGPACDCTKDIEACRSPYNGLICHGFGECICGKCQCFTRDGNLHKGKYCEDCGKKLNLLAIVLIWKPQTVILKKDNSGLSIVLCAYV